MKSRVSTSKLGKNEFEKRFSPYSWNVRFWRSEHTKLDFSHLRAVGFDHPKCSATAQSHLHSKLNTLNTLAKSERTFEVSTWLGRGSQIVIFAHFAKSVIWHLLAYEVKSTFESSSNWSNQLFHQKLAQKQHLGLFENFSIFRPFCDHLVTGRAAENWPNQVLSGEVENSNSKNLFFIRVCEWCF